MRIIITGSPGTGKSSVSKALARLSGLRLIDIKGIVRAKGLLGRGGTVDIRRLARALSFLREEKSFIAEGHLACEVRLPADWIVVLRTRPSMLRRRLRARGYGKRKLDENVMAEMLDYCTQRVQAVYGKAPLELETSKRTPRSSARLIALAIKHKKKKLDRVDYSRELLESAVAPQK